MNALRACLSGGTALVLWLPAAAAPVPAPTPAPPAAVASAAALEPPLSNQAFAARVRALRAAFAEQPEAVGQAALLCTHLPAHRAADEPACLALRLHLKPSAGATRTAPSAAGRSTPMADAAAGLLACARSRVGAVLSDLLSRDA